MDNYNLARFIEAQRFSYDTAFKEIRNGRKESHWVWYIFPQLKGLGHSYNSQYYGISGREEAVAYLEHPVLGARLREISAAVLAIEGKSAVEILSRTDAVKVRSCMTLFDSICPNDIFAKVLDKYYNGKLDRRSQL